MFGWFRKRSHVHNCREEKEKAYAAGRTVGKREGFNDAIKMAVQEIELFADKIKQTMKK